MTNKRAIVTLAIGESYIAMWHRDCEPSWRRYAEKHHFDLVYLDQPLDTSSRASSRSASWQKCLVLGQDFARRYERVVWLDADILINDREAPDVTAGVPLEKVGAVEETYYSRMEPIAAQRLLTCMGELWPHMQYMIRYTAREFYGAYGLPDDCDQVINAGVMVLSPQHHRSLMERVYYDYEGRTGREWHMEMRPLSYELNHAGLVHLIDPRFNLTWIAQKLLYYPFLLQPLSRVKRKIGSLVGLDLHRACINATFQRSYFLHFAGHQQAHEMSMISKEG